MSPGLLKPVKVENDIIIARNLKQGFEKRGKNEPNAC